MQGGSSYNCMTNALNAITASLKVSHVFSSELLESFTGPSVNVIDAFKCYSLRKMVNQANANSNLLLNAMTDCLTNMVGAMKVEQDVKALML